MLKHGDQVYLPFEPTCVPLRGNNVHSSARRWYCSRPKAPNQRQTATVQTRISFYTGAHSRHRLPDNHIVNADMKNTTTMETMCLFQATMARIRDQVTLHLGHINPRLNVTPALRKKWSYPTRTNMRLTMAYHPSLLSHPMRVANHPVIASHSIPKHPPCCTQQGHTRSR